jgi:hypothetical protein
VQEWESPVGFGAGLRGLEGIRASNGNSKIAKQDRRIKFEVPGKRAGQVMPRPLGSAAYLANVNTTVMFVLTSIGLPLSRKGL